MANIRTIVSQSLSSSEEAGNMQRMLMVSYSEAVSQSLSSSEEAGNSSI